MSKILISLDIPAVPPYTVFFREAGDMEFDVLRSGLQEEDFPFFHRGVEVGDTIEYFIADTSIDDPLEFKDDFPEEFEDLLFSCVGKPEPDLVVAQADLNRDGEEEDRIGNTFIAVDLAKETTPPYRLGRDGNVLLSEDAEFPYKDEGLEPGTEYEYMVTDACLQMDHVVAQTKAGELVIITLSATNINAEKATINGEIESITDVSAVRPSFAWGQTDSPFPNVEELPTIDNPQEGDTFSARLENLIYYEKDRMYERSSKIRSVAIEPDNNIMAVAPEEGYQPRIFDSLLDEVAQLGSESSNDWYVNGPERMDALTFHPGDNRLAVAAYDNRVRIYDSDFNKIGSADIAIPNPPPPPNYTSAPGVHDDFGRPPGSLTFYKRSSSIAWDPTSDRIAVGEDRSQVRDQPPSPDDDYDKDLSSENSLRIAVVSEGPNGNFSQEDIFPIQNTGTNPNGDFNRVSDLTWDKDSGALAATVGGQAGGSRVVYDSNLNEVSRIDVPFDTNNGFGFASVDWHENLERTLAVGTNNRVRVIQFDEDFNITGSTSRFELQPSPPNDDEYFNAFARWDENKDILIVATPETFVFALRYDEESQSIQKLNRTNVELRGHQFTGIDTFEYDTDLAKGLIGVSPVDTAAILRYRGDLEPNENYKFEAIGQAPENDLVSTSRGSTLDFDTPGKQVIANTLNAVTEGVSSAGSRVILNGKLDSVTSDVSIADGMSLSFEIDDENFVENNDQPDITKDVPGLFRSDREVSTDLSEIEREFVESQDQSLPGETNDGCIAADENQGLVAAGVGGSVAIYDAETLNEVFLIDEQEGIDSGVSEINDLVWSSKNGRLGVAASSSNNNSAYVFVPQFDGSGNVTDFKLATDVNGNSDFSDGTFGSLFPLFGGIATSIDFEPSTGRLAIQPTGDTAFNRRAVVYTEDYKDFARVSGSGTEPIARSISWNPNNGDLSIGKASGSSADGKLKVYSGFLADIGDPSQDLGDLDLQDPSGSSRLNLSEPVQGLPIYDVEHDAVNAKVALATGPHGTVEVYDNNFNLIDSIEEVGSFVEDPLRGERDGPAALLSVQEIANGKYAINGDGSIRWANDSFFGEGEDNIAVGYNKTAYFGTEQRDEDGIGTDIYKFGTVDGFQDVDQDLTTLPEPRLHEAPPEIFGARPGFYIRNLAVDNEGFVYAAYSGGTPGDEKSQTDGLIKLSSNMENSIWNVFLPNWRNRRDWDYHRVDDRLGHSINTSGYPMVRTHIDIRYSNYADDLFLTTAPDTDWILNFLPPGTPPIDNQTYGRAPNTVIQRRDKETGDVIWETTALGDRSGRVSIAPSATEDAIYAVGGNALGKFDMETGDLIWRDGGAAQLCAEIDSDQNGNIYVIGHVNPTVTKYDPNGSQLWSEELEEGLWQSRAFERGGISDFNNIKSTDYRVRVGFKGDIIYNWVRGESDGNLDEGFIVHKRTSDGDLIWEQQADGDNELQVYLRNLGLEKKHEINNVSFDPETGWLAVPKKSSSELPTTIYNSDLELQDKVDCGEYVAGDAAWNASAPLDEQAIRLVKTPEETRNIEGHRGPIILDSSKTYYFRLVAEGQDEGGDNVTDEGDLVSFSP